MGRRTEVFRRFWLLRNLRTSFSQAQYSLSPLLQYLKAVLEANMTSFPAEKGLSAEVTPAKDVEVPDRKLDAESGLRSNAGVEVQYSRQRWYQYFSPDDTPAERRLVLKLDALIIVFVFLAYWAKVLDSSSTSTAYVSGMKEDLKLYGNQLNYLNTVYM